MLLLTKGAVLKHRASRFSQLTIENDLMQLREWFLLEESITGYDVPLDGDL